MSRTQELRDIICESDWDVAVIAAEELVGLEPESASAWSMLGMCRKWNDGHNGAIAAFERALELGEQEQIPPRSKARLLTHIGEINRWDDELERAEGILREAIELEPDCRRHFLLGDTLRHLGRKDEAIAHAKCALQFDASDDEACCLMAILIQDEQPEEAERLLRVAVKESIERGYACDELGDLLAKQKRYAEAEVYLHEAVQRDPSCEFKHLKLGFVKRQQGKVEDAEPHYLRATEVAPKSELCHRYMGHFYRDTGRPELAEVWYRKAVELEPENPKAIYALAWFLYKNERLVESSIWTEKLLILDPDHEDALSMKDCLYDDESDS